MLAGYEILDFTSRTLDGRISGDGWTAGGYLGWRVLPGLVFGAGAAYSGMNYKGVAGTATGKFPADRLTLTSSLAGTYRLGRGFEVEPSARVFGVWQDERAYTDSLGTRQEARSFKTGRASAGGKLAYAWAWSDAVTITPFAGLYADYYFTADDAAREQLPELIQGWSARVASGVSVASSRARFGLGIEHGGIGSGQLRVWTLRGLAMLTF